MERTYNVHVEMADGEAYDCTVTSETWNWLCKIFETSEKVEHYVIDDIEMK